MRKRLAIILGLITYSSSLFGMKTDKITKNSFQKKEIQFCTQAVDRWLEKKPKTSNHLFKAFASIKETGIENILQDKAVFTLINNMLTTIKRDNRYHEAQQLLKKKLTPISLFSYKKKILILGLQILIVYAGIRPPEIIKPTSQSKGIVSDEQAFLAVNYGWDKRQLPQLKAALLLLSLELIKAQK